jgi:hypothetical protein
VHSPPHPALSSMIGGEGRVRGSSCQYDFETINKQLRAKNADPVPLLYCPLALGKEGGWGG